MFFNLKYLNNFQQRTMPKKEIEATNDENRFLESDKTQSDMSNLSYLQRIILITDGTLTDILEAYLLEPLRVLKISEKVEVTSKDIPILELEAGSEVIDRKIFLQGKNSKKNFLYAESKIVIGRLDEDFQNGLLKSQTPIGHLWLKFRLESFKEIIDSGKEPVNELSAYFIDTEPKDQLLFRTYRVFSNRKPIMMITEKFPQSYFI
jgi:chorismate-pyruvate lyase